MTDSSTAIGSVLPVFAVGAAADASDVTVAQLLALTTFITTTDPLLTSDSANGYFVGQRWVNTTGTRTWECVSATIGAAVWRRTGGPPSAIVANAGTVGNYLFNGDGNNSSGAAANLGVSGTPAYAHGFGGRRVYRGNSGNNFNVADAALNLSDDLCVEMLIFPRYAATSYIHTFMQYGPNATRRYFVDFDNASTALIEVGYWNGSTDVVIGTQVQTESWSLVTMTRVVDGGNTTLDLYVNGMLAATDTRAGGPTSASSSLYVGRNATNATTQVLSGEYIGGLHFSTTIPSAAEIALRAQRYLPLASLGS